MEQELLKQFIQELALLRQAVERIAIQLETRPQKASPKLPAAPLSESDCRRLYQEILSEYKETRKTGKLDAVLARSKADLSLFCSVNNLPIDLRNGKAGIREKILAHVREDEQLAASYPMPTRDPALVAERNEPRKG